MVRLLPLVFAVCVGACDAAEWPTARLGQKAAWEAATDRVARSRFIPMQLIVPSGWDGTRRIDMPIAEGVDSEGTVWTGFDYVCLSTRGGQVVERRRSARITIEELDYEYNGVAHSLRIGWRFADRDSGEVLDHRTYIFSPGRGLAAHFRR